MTSRLYTVAALLLVCAAVPLALYAYVRRTYTITLWEGSEL